MTRLGKLLYEEIRRAHSRIPIESHARPAHGACGSYRDLDPRQGLP